MLRWTVVRSDVLRGVLEVPPSSSTPRCAPPRESGPPWVIPVPTRGTHLLRCELSGLAVSQRPSFAGGPESRSIHAPSGRTAHRQSDAQFPPLEARSRPAGHTSQARWSDPDPMAHSWDRLMKTPVTEQVTGITAPGRRISRSQLCVPTQPPDTKRSRHRTPIGSLEQTCPKAWTNPTPGVRRVRWSVVQSHDEHSTLQAMDWPY